MARYTALFYPAEAGGFGAMAPLLNLATEGDTVEHALEMAREAVELRIESMAQDGEPILEEETAPIITAIDVEIPIAAPA